MKKNNFLINVFFFICLLLCIAFTNCEPQKRINRILNRHPELKRDTVLTIHDTTFTKAFTFDTLYNVTHTRDTIVLERKNVEVKIFHHNDTIFLKTIVKPDTIYKTIKIPYSKIVYTIDERKKWLMFWLGMASVLIFIVLFYIVLKWIKP